MKVHLILFLVLLASQLQAQEQQPISGQKFTLLSNILGEEKEIYISLPPDYSEAINDYPVIYVLEAEFLFNVTQSITRILTLRSEMPFSIIVGVTNGGPGKRSELTLPTQGGRVTDHLKFFRNELIPHIESHYRVNEHRTIMGLSPTTGFVLEAFWSEPDLFSAYISLCTHLAWNPRKDVKMIDKLIEAITDPNHPKSTIYMGRADGDLEWNKFARTTFEEADRRLKTTRSEKVRFQLEALKDEEHYAMSPSGIRNAFKLIYPHGTSMFLTYRDSDDIAGDLKNHFENLSIAYGFSVYPVNFGEPHADSILGLVKYLTRFKKDHQAIELLELGLMYFPNSARLHMRLAGIYKQQGDNKKATDLGEKAINLATLYRSDLLSSFRDKLKSIKN